MGLGFGPPSHRPAHARPIGRPLTGPLEAFDVHEAFQQMDGVFIQALPIVADTPGDPSQQVTGQMGNANPRSNQVSAVVSDEMEVVGVRLPGSSDERVAQLELQGP